MKYTPIKLVCTNIATQIEYLHKTIEANKPNRSKNNNNNTQHTHYSRTQFVISIYKQVYYRICVRLAIV